MGRQGFGVGKPEPLAFELVAEMYFLGRSYPFSVREQGGKFVIDDSYIESTHIREAFWEAVSGLQHAEVASKTGAKERGKPAFPSRRRKRQKPDPTSEMMVVTSGKDNYFGPVVTAGIRTDEKNKAIMADIITAPNDDISTLPDYEIARLADALQTVYEHSLIIMTPAGFNGIYEEVHDMDLMLSWTQLRVMVAVERQKSTARALCDAFFFKPLLTQNLAAKQLDMTLGLGSRQEQPLLFHAATILARHALLEQFNEYKKRFNMSFEEGAGEAVLATAQALVDEYGADILRHVAKVHFSLTSQLKTEKDDKGATPL